MNYDEARKIVYDDLIKHGMIPEFHHPPTEEMKKRIIKIAEEIKDGNVGEW